MAFWDNKEFNLDPEIIVPRGLLTIVDGMVQVKTRERKKIFLEGAYDKITEKLSEILLKNKQIFLYNHNTNIMRIHGDDCSNKRF